MTGLTYNLENFYKNINNLKNQIEFTENNNRFALKYYLESFEFKFNEFKNDDFIKNSSTLRKQKLNDLILHHDKIKKLSKKGRFSFIKPSMRPILLLFIIGFILLLAFLFGYSFDQLITCFVFIIHL